MLPRRSSRDASERAPRQPQRGATSGKATASLILGLVSLCVPVLPSILAIVFGFLGLADVRQGKRGKGLAITGLATGFLTLVICPFAYAGIFFYSMQRIREAAARMESMNNVKQIAIAMHAHHEGKKKLPNHAIYKDGKPLLSWRVAVLEYMGPAEKALFSRFRLDEPWDSPTNLILLKSMPQVYAHPADPDGNAQGLTHYQVFVSEPGMSEHPIFVKEPEWRITLHSITDGASNTILVAEAAKAVPWTKPEDIVFSPHQPVLPQLGLPKATTLVVGFADGAANSLAINKIDDQNLRTAISMNDGRVNFLE